MSRFRVTGAALLASAAIGLTSPRRARRRFMTAAKDYITQVTAPVTDMDRPDHRPEGVRPSKLIVYVSDRPAQRRRPRRRRRRRGSGQGDRLGLPRHRRPGLGARRAPTALTQAIALQAGRHHPRRDRRRRAGAGHRAGGRGRASRSSAGIPGRRPARSTACPACSPTSPPTRSRSPRRRRSTRSSIPTARPASIIFTDSIYAIAIAKTRRDGGGDQELRGCKVLAIEDTPIGDARQPHAAAHHVAAAAVRRPSGPIRCDQRSVLRLHGAVAAVGRHRPATASRTASRPATAPVPAFQRIRDGEYQVGTVAEPLRLQGWQDDRRAEPRLRRRAAERLRRPAASVHQVQHRQGRRRRRTSSTRTTATGTTTRRSGASSRQPIESSE